jgi:hypothetical protein
MVDKDANETPAGLTSKDAQERVLGYSQPSLRDWRNAKSTQDSRPGLLSATFVPAGLSSGPTGSHAAPKARRKNSLNEGNGLQAANNLMLCVRARL